MNASTRLEATFASAGMDLCYMKINMTARRVSTEVFEQLLIQLSHRKLCFQKKEIDLGNGDLNIRA